MSQEPPEKMMFQLALRRRGISDQAVLRTMEAVPREVFVAAGDRGHAYRDSALGIACGQTISQPFVVAYMTEQLQLQKHHRVLEIGTGSGYQAAILSRLCRQVLTVERYRTLADSARARLEKLGCDNVDVMFGDGFDVPASAGNFDRIIVTAAMDRALERHGKRSRLDHPNDPSIYSLAHNRFHPQLREFADRYGYRDLLLLDLVGNVPNFVLEGRQRVAC
jgi:protein-L-isoaspartate(D-aspartate) O-methyltransferase